VFPNSGLDLPIGRGYIRLLFAPFCSCAVTEAHHKMCAMVAKRVGSHT